MNEQSHPIDLSPRAFREEVRKRLGVLPSFFRSAAEVPEVTENLWGFAKFGYLDNPLPSSFKERLFVYLSQFCGVRYCLARHVGFLLGLGQPAGDPCCAPQSVEQVVRLIRRPLPQQSQLEPYLILLENHHFTILTLPGSDSVEEQALIACATHVFLQTPQAARCLEALRHALDGVAFQQLLVFLTFVQTAHFWTKVHPEIRLESDVEQLLTVHEALAECVLSESNAANCETSQGLLHELELLRSEREEFTNARFLASLVANSEDAILSRSLDGIIQTWNLGAQRLFGHTPAQAVGQHISLIIPKNRVQEEELIQNRLMAGERIEHYETIRVCRDGRMVDVSLTVSPIRDFTGDIIAVSKTLRDITERKHTEDQLRLYQKVITNMQDAVMITDAEPTDLPGPHIRYVNPAFTQLTGFSSDEVFGKTPRILQGPKTDRRELDKIRSALSHQKSTHAELINYRKDGSEFETEVNIVPVTEETGRITHWVSIQRDITERKLTEEAMRVADRRKDEFLATLAHELRNPLAPLRNGLQIMRLAGTSKLTTQNDAFEQAQTMMERQLGHLIRLVDDLLEVSRISQGKLELRCSRIELKSVLDCAVETNRHLIEQMGHTLIIEIPPQSLMIDADLTRLSQVFLNLLNNAAKYSEYGSTIWLTAEQQGKDVIVTVRDTGIGIAAEQIHRIFDIFSQVDQSLEKAHGGLGIGLTLVKRLVEMHGGTVEAKSDGPGCGSSFIVTLPLAVKLEAV